MLLPTWQRTLDEEMQTLVSRGIWDLVNAPQVPHCEIQIHIHGSLDKYKPHLGCKRFSYVWFGTMDYFETFSPATCLNSIQFLFSLAFNLDWAMFQLNFENTFLYGYMHEEIYKEQPSDYVAQGESIACKFKKTIYGFKQPCQSNFLGLKLHIRNVDRFFLKENVLDLLEETSLLGCKHMLVL